MNPTPFELDIAQQPDALRALVAYYRGDGRQALMGWVKLAREHKRIVFAGMGASSFAPESIRVELAHLRIDASIEDAGELSHYPRPVFGLLTLISQSGESVETKSLAITAKPPVVLAAVTNNTQSTLAKAARIVLPLCAGSEAAISVKTYVNTLALLHLMAVAARDMRSLAPALDRLDRLVETMAQIDREAIDRAARLLADGPAIQCVSRGPAMVAARQAALTFMEGARLPAAAFTGGAFRHGPFELVDASLRAVFFIPACKPGELLAAMATEVAGLGAMVVAIADHPVALPGRRTCVLTVPDVGEDLFALSAATTQAWLVAEVARARDLQAGAFRHGQKITTRE